MNMPDDKEKKEEKVTGKKSRKKEISFVIPEVIEGESMKNENTVLEEDVKQENMSNSQIVSSETIKPRRGRKKGSKNKHIPVGEKKQSRQITIYLDEILYQKSKMIALSQSKNITEIIQEYLQKYVLKYQDAVKQLFGI